MTKKYLFLFFATVFGFMNSLSAQEATGGDTAAAKTPGAWTIKNTVLFSAEQSLFNNWAQGGISSLSIGANYKGFFNFKKGKHAWDNTIELGYGIVRQDLNKKGVFDKGNHFQKNEDKIELNTSYSLKAISDWNYNATLNLKSQFDDGYNKDSVLVASFFSPAYLISSVGMELKKPTYYILLSCFTGKTTFVGDARLAKPGNFGLEEGETNWHFALGSYVKLQYQKDIFKNVNLLSKLELFYDYATNLAHTDVNWEVFVMMKINSYLNAFVNFQMIFDRDFSEQIQWKQRAGISIPLSF